MRIIIGDVIIKSSSIVKSKYEEIDNSIERLRVLKKHWSIGQARVSGYLRERYENRFMGICIYRNSKVLELLKSG